MALIPKTEQVLTYLTPADRDRLDRYADQAGISRADAVRRAVLGLLLEEEATEAKLKTLRELQAERDRLNRLS